MILCTKCSYLDLILDQVPTHPSYTSCVLKLVTTRMSLNSKIYLSLIYTSESPDT